MIRRVVNSLYHRYNRCPVWGSGSPPAMVTFCGFVWSVSKARKLCVNYWGVTTPSVTLWRCFSPEKCLNAWEVPCE